MIIHIEAAKVPILGPLIVHRVGIASAHCPFPVQKTSLSGPFQVNAKGIDPNLPVLAPCYNFTGIGYRTA